MSEPTSTSCEQMTYLEWGHPEADYEVSPAVIGPFVVAFVCDGLGPKDCGWQQEWERGDLTGGVNSADFAAADAAHRAAHRAATESARTYTCPACRNPNAFDQHDRHCPGQPPAPRAASGESS